MAGFRKVGKIFLNFMSQFKQILKKTAYWILPAGVNDYLKQQLINNLLSKYNQKQYRGIFSLVKKNSKLKNKHHNKRCFILATGPSVNKQNLAGLENELCIAVSHFYLHPQISTIKPNYHVIAPNHEPFNFELIQSYLDGLNKYYDQDTIYFFGYRPYQYSILDFLNTFPEYQDNKNLYFLNYHNSPILQDDNYDQVALWDITRQLFAIRTVVYSAIQIAMYMGCKEIYLIGCDHDYLNDTSRMSNNHFYQDDNNISYLEHLSQFTTEKWFEEYYFRWQQYRLMLQYARSQKCQIFNATMGGMLDVFPRVNLNEII